VVAVAVGVAMRTGWLLVALLFGSALWTLVVYGLALVFLVVF